MGQRGPMNGHARRTLVELGALAVHVVDPEAGDADPALAKKTAARAYAHVLQTDNQEAIDKFEEIVASKMMSDTRTLCEACNLALVHLTYILLR